MVVVATADFELYHEVVTTLRDRGVEFTTVEPDDELPEGATVVVTGEDEEVPVPAGVEVVRASPENPRGAIESVLALTRGGGGRTVVGVDPGERPGIAVLKGDVVVATFQVPADRAAERLVGARIIDDLSVPVELVDETGTTPYLGAGTRGMGDVLAAVNIARIEGERVDERDIDPTAGELQRIKDRSRERSETNRAIDETLARRVAGGELTIEEALAEHREE
ncbi:hypothetical protein BRD09_08010 [Halobacteriales archaeon SW_10_68_16]|nr:MAG: hypothetical protein BRD09_08010 [Halobacteriales archaeon SW_10_68_16]